MAASGGIGFRQVRVLRLNLKRTTTVRISLSSVVFSHRQFLPPATTPVSGTSQTKILEGGGPCLALRSVHSI